MANYPKRDYVYVILGIALGIYFFAACATIILKSHSVLTTGWVWVVVIVPYLLLGLVMILCSISLAMKVSNDKSTFDNESVFSNSEKSEKPSSGTYTLTIRQDPQFYLIKVGFRIVVDGSIEKRLRNQSDVAYVDLSCGEHTLDIKGSIRSKQGRICLERDTTMFLSWDRFTGSIRFRFERT